MCDAPKYGKTRVSKVLADIDRLRTAIRAHDDEAAEQAWEKVERWTGFIAGSVSRADAITAPSWHRIDDPENPPPKDGTKMLAFDGIGPFTVEWDNGEWIGSETDGDPLPSDDLPITHWMHLPQPPKEGE